MKIDKAIEILSDAAYKGSPTYTPDFKDALKLGLEALKAYRKSQEARWYPPGYKLPGETSKEVDNVTN